MGLTIELRAQCAFGTQPLQGNLGANAVSLALSKHPRLPAYLLLPWATSDYDTFVQIFLDFCTS